MTGISHELKPSVLRVSPGEQVVTAAVLLKLNEPAKDQVAFAVPVGCSAPPAAAVVRA
jgi:hypothetical protein